MNELRIEEEEEEEEEGEGEGVGGGPKRHATDADDDNEFWAPPAGLTPTAIINWAANGNGIS